MKLEQINPTQLTLDMAIKDRQSLYYIVASDDKESPYKLLSFSKEGLNLPANDYILIKLDVPQVEKVITENNKKSASPKKRLERDYKFVGMNDNNTIRISWSITGNKYGGIRVSFERKEDANDYHDYFREQFYNRDISSINVKSIYEDLGINKDKIEKECPNAWKWGYPVLGNGPCKYMTEVTKNKNDKWYGFTFLPPVIVNGMEESGWLAKQKELCEAS